MIYSACPVVRPTPLMSPGLKHKRRKRKPTLDDDMPPLNVSLSPSIYTHSLIQSQQETHPLYIYSLHSVNSAPSSSSAVTSPPPSVLLIIMLQDATVDANQRRPDKQWLPVSFGVWFTEQDAAVSRGISLLQLITLLVFVAVSDFIYFSLLPVQTVLS